MERRKVEVRLVRGQHLVGKEGGGYRQLAIGEVITIHEDQFAHLRNKFQLVDPVGTQQKAPETPMNPAMMEGTPTTPD